MIGLRLGATIAAEVAAERGDVASVVLWHPFVNGAELHRARRCACTRCIACSSPRASRRAPRTTPTATRRSASSSRRRRWPTSRRSTCWPWRASRRRKLLVIDAANIPSDEPLLERLRGLGADVSYRHLPGHKFLISIPHKSAVPQEIIDAIVALVRRDATRRAPRPPPPADRPPGTHTRLDVRGGAVRVRRRRQPLFGVLVKPAASRVRKGRPGDHHDERRHGAPHRPAPALRRAGARAGRARLRRAARRPVGHRRQPGVGGRGEPVLPGRRHRRWPARDDRSSARGSAPTGSSSPACARAATSPSSSACSDRRVAGVVMMNPRTFCVHDLAMVEAYKRARYYQDSFFKKEKWVKLLTGKVDLAPRREMVAPKVKGEVVRRVQTRARSRAPGRAATATRDPRRRAGVPARDGRARRRHLPRRRRARSRRRLRRRPLRQADERARVAAELPARGPRRHRPHLHLAVGAGARRAPRSASTSRSGTSAMIAGYAALEPKAALVPFSYEPGELGPHGVELEVTPLRPVLQRHPPHRRRLEEEHATRSSPATRSSAASLRRGAEVTHLEVGQRVGVGWQRSACLTCELCLTGHENLCPTQTATCVGHHGGLADRMIARRPLRVRRSPTRSTARPRAPLLCGGVTVYSPMRRYGVNGREPGRRHRHRRARPHGDRDPEGDGRRGRRLLVDRPTSDAGAAPDGRARLRSRSTDVREIRKLGGTHRSDPVDRARAARLGRPTSRRCGPTACSCLLGGGTGLIQLLAARAARAALDLTTGEIGDARRHRRVLALRRAPRDRADDRGRADARASASRARPLCARTRPLPRRPPEQSLTRWATALYDSQVEVWGPAMPPQRALSWISTRRFVPPRCTCVRPLEQRLQLATLDLAGVRARDRVARRAG